MLTLSEVKQWLRLEESDTAEDALLQAIMAATQEYLRNALPSWIDLATNPMAKILALAMVADMYENREMVPNIQFAVQASGMRPTIRALMTQLQYAYPAPEEGSS